MFGVRNIKNLQSFNVKTLISPCNSIRQFDSLSMPLKNVKKKTLSSLPNKTIEQKSFYFVDSRQQLNLNNWWLETARSCGCVGRGKLKSIGKLLMASNMVLGSRNSESKLRPNPIFGLLFGTKAINLLTRTSVESNSFWREEQKRKENAFKCLNEVLSGFYSFQFLHFSCLPISSSSFLQFLSILIFNIHSFIWQKNLFIRCGILHSISPVRWLFPLIETVF